VLREFMGAIWTRGDRFLNYLLNEDQNERIHYFSSRLKSNSLLNDKCEVYLFGSYLRHKIFDDIDIILVYGNGSSSHEIDTWKREIIQSIKTYSTKLDFTVCSKDEFSKMSLTHDNRVKVL
jgi:predicted nucleotidyltransferase